MASPILHLRVEAGEPARIIERGIAAIQDELDVSAEFTAEVEAAAREAAADPLLPERDRTELPLVTIDPATSLDLDQAVHLARDGAGYRLSYAIADVAAFVRPGGPVDAEAHRRGETLYGADSKIPLHPKVISEDAGSLLAGQDRPALLWTLSLDADGAVRSAAVERALVRSREKLSYPEVQRRLDTGSADESLQLLREVGRLRIAAEAARGGVSLPLPEQEVTINDDEWGLDFRSQLPVEQWNAQVSLLTGMTAAAMMIDAGVGVLRTLPSAAPRDVERLRRKARALGIDWPAGRHYAEFIRSLDPQLPAHAAMVVACTRLLRGSGYVAFDGAVPDDPGHAAVAAPYTHVTAPLRRLVDRYSGEICLAVSAGRAVPGWVGERLEGLPETMREAGRRANQYQGAVLDLVEAGLLRHRVGETFPGIVIDVSDKTPTRGTITINEPAVEAPVESAGALPLGSAVPAVLTEADPVNRRVRFSC